MFILNQLLDHRLTSHGHQFGSIVTASRLLGNAMYKHFVTFIFPTLTQLNISISNVIGITWRVGGAKEGSGGTNIPSILSLRGTSKKDFLNNYLGCVKAEKKMLN